MPARRTVPFVQYYSDKQPYVGCLPVSAELLVYAVSGFEICSLPALNGGQQQSYSEIVGEVLYRFQMYLLELHDVGVRRAVALQIMADPDQSTMNAKIRIYVLCRSACADADSAIQDVRTFATRTAQSFPRGAGFNYGQAEWMGQEALDFAFFRCEEWNNIDIVELRKFEDRQTWSGQQALHYVPHRFWADKRREPWLSLIENLAACTQPTAVRIEMTPARLDSSNGLDLVAGAGRWFAVIGEDLDRKSSQGEQVRPDGVVTSEMMRKGEVDAASSSAAHISYVQRGRHVYQNLIANSDRLFGMRVVLAAREHVQDSLLGAVRAALSSPPADDPTGTIGWVRPDYLRPQPNEAKAALDNLHSMIQTRWGRTPPNPAIGRFVDLRYVVTPEEAVSLFHLPVFHQSGETSALSTAETPFVIPPESLSTTRFKDSDRKVRLGYMYQREQYLGPDDAGNGGQPFYVTTDDLMKPSLLVGAPGSGKSNLAFSLLIQLWKEHRMPFLVLDPSTGQEYRGLLGIEGLKEDLIVYTVGDPDVLPLQFNPFSIPPGVTVRNHTTRILAAFKAAYEMFDPVPAIYEAALERIYCNERYTGKGRALTMESKGSPTGFAPTLSDFARAVQDELTEKALVQYKGSDNTIGIIRGACGVRINAIGKKLGYIVNTPQNNTDFFRRLLERPAVIELGALGDSTSIALLMAFMISQLSGQIEHAARQMSLAGKKREHLMLIEEAHRLLAAGSKDGATGKSAEDLNVMLAEIRKFGQGILILDQRPSSLVGGVMDNAYVKILTRLSDKPGFERLSDELNLNDVQRRFAHTRLKKGDAIVLDRDAGQPVLTKAEYVPLKRFNDALEVETIRANAKRWELTPPEAFPYFEPETPLESKKEEKPATPKPAPVAASKTTEKGRDWLVGEMERGLRELMEKERNQSAVYHAIAEKLKLKHPDLEGAVTAGGNAMAVDRAGFDRLADEIWGKARWAMTSLIAEEVATKEVIEELARMRASAKIQPEAAKPAQAAPVAPSFEKPTDSVPVKNAKRWLNRPVEELTDALSRSIATLYGKAEFYEKLKASILKSPTELEEAYQLVSAELEPGQSLMDQISRRLWEQVKWTLIGIVAVDQKAQSAAQQAATRKNTATGDLEKPKTKAASPKK